MLVFPVFSVSFWVFYSLAGLSDFLDGIIARILKAESKIGAILDSIADLVFFVIIAFLLLSKVSLPLWMIISISAIALIRIIAYLIGFIKYKGFISIHTYLNKFIGLCLFLSPILFYFWGLGITGIVLISIAAVSSLEEMLIDITSKQVELDRKGLFIK